MEFNKAMIEKGEFGVVENVRHPILSASGLPGARLNEIVMFETGEMGEIFIMNRETIEIWKA